MRHVAAMMTGTVDIIDKGSEFEKAKALLEAKYQQYNELFPIEEGESVIICFKPTKAVTWDYVAGELRVSLTPPFRHVPIGRDSSSWCQ